MNFLFLAYCFGSPGGDSLIGVYKRALRIGLVLVERGHDVAILCPGRHVYRDELVQRAESACKFVDFPLEVLFEQDVSRRRSHYRAILEELQIDVVVAGEAPIAGTLLDGTVTAVESRVPVVVVDNAYGPEHVAHLLGVGGGAALLEQLGAHILDVAGGELGELDRGGLVDDRGDRVVGRDGELAHESEAGGGRGSGAE